MDNDKCAMIGQNAFFNPTNICILFFSFFFFLRWLWSEQNAHKHVHTLPTILKAFLLAKLRKQMTQAEGAHMALQACLHGLISVRCQIYLNT